jgi:hypothetical protein
MACSTTTSSFFPYNITIVEFCQDHNAKFIIIKTTVPNTFGALSIDFFNIKVNHFLNLNKRELNELIYSHVLIIETTV